MWVDSSMPLRFRWLQGVLALLLAGPNAAWETLQPLLEWRPLLLLPIASMEASAMLWNRTVRLYHIVVY